MIRFIRLALFCLTCGLLPNLAAAQVEGLDNARLLSGWRQADGTFVAAMALDLQPEWKTYWRAPGSGGIPPEFDWTGSDNLASLRLVWPRPVVFDQDGVASIGFHDALVLPMVITAVDPDLPVGLRLRMTLGLCKDICTPVTLSLQAVLTAGGSKDPQIMAAMADVPQERAGGVVCQTAPIADGLRVTARVDLAKVDVAPDAHVILEYKDPKIWISDPQIVHLGGQLVATMDMVPKQAKPFDLRGQDVLVTVLAQDHAVEIQGCPVSAALP